ncbi:MAG: hypothetical protein K9K67_09485 [Bacteriovoracaceae bacterium]|nr:hypothetical protein [Bacteriovoracaceae bacterium]
MKKIITILFTIFCASLLAQAPVGGIGNDGGGPKQSWQDIYKNPNLNPTFPMYDIQGRNISYRHLCLMGERVRTKYKHVVNPTTDYTKLIFDYLVTDRVREEQYCAEYLDFICIQWEIKTIEIPLKDIIKVYKKTEPVDPNQESQWEMSFEKTYELQECEED